LKEKSIIASIFTISMIGIFSKIFGFIRETITANYFGATVATDTYFLAYGIISSLIVSIGAAIGIGILPLYKERSISNSEEEGANFSSRIISLVLFLTVLITLFIVVFAPYLSFVFAPTFSNEARHLLTNFIRLLAPQFIFSSIVYILSALLNVNKKYGVSELTAVLYSLFAIISIIFFSKWIGLYALILAAPISSFIQMLILFSYLKRSLNVNIGLKKFKIDDFKIMSVILPIILGNATFQITQLIDKVIASSLTEGSVSAISYSGTLNSFINIAITTSIITVLYTELTNDWVNNDIARIKRDIRKGITTLSLLIVPISIITVIFSEEIVTLIFGRGNFDYEAVKLTSLALKFYIIGSVFYGLRNYLIRAFYAMQDSKTPLKNTIVIVIINSILSLLLSIKLGVGGITLASAISAMGAFLLMIRSLSKKLNGLDLIKIAPTALKIVISTIITCLILVILHNILHDMVLFYKLLLSSIACFGVYFLVLILMKCQELNPVLNKCIKIFRKIIRMN